MPPTKESDITDWMDDLNMVVDQIYNRMNAMVTICDAFSVLHPESPTVKQLHKTIDIMQEWTTVLSSVSGKIVGEQMRAADMASTGMLRACCAGVAMVSPDIAKHLMPIIEAVN